METVSRLPGLNEVEGSANRSEGGLLPTRFGNRCIDSADFAAPITLRYTACIYDQGLSLCNSVFVQASTALLLISSAVTNAQNPPQNPSSVPSWMSAPQTSTANFPPLLIQQLSAIKAAALNDDYGYRQLAHLTENIGPRPTGSPQATAAAEYVAAELRKLGLEVRLEPVTVPHWVRGAETAALVEYPGMVPTPRKKSFSPLSAEALPLPPTASPPT